VQRSNLMFRFASLITLVLLSAEGVTLRIEDDDMRPHKEVSPPVVLARTSDDADADADAQASESEASDEKEDDEKKDEEKDDDKKDDEAKEEEEDKSNSTKDDDKKDDKDEKSDDVPLPPSNAAFFGPGGCVATFRSPKGSCIMQTRCAKQNTEEYEYGLTCVDEEGKTARHLFGANSFNAEETFDTLINCKLCLGVDGSGASPDKVELAADVHKLQAEMEEVKDNIKLIMDHIEPEKKDDKKDEASDSDAASTDDADSTDDAASTSFLHAKAPPSVARVELKPAHIKRAAKHPILTFDGVP